MILNSAAGTTKVAIDELRAKRCKGRSFEAKAFRPFPRRAVNALKHVKAIACLDRVDSMSGFGGPLFNDIRSAMYELDARPRIISRIYGLGGRDYKVKDAIAVFDELANVKKTGVVDELTKYITI